MTITAQTTLNLVIGFPLAHSHSPLLHRAMYQALGYDAVLLACAQPVLKPLLQVIRTLAIPLAAVTMPFKEEVLFYLDHCDAQARELGAVNTIIQREGQLYGYNTDVYGIAYALRHTPVADKNVLIIGAGGVARACASFLRKQRAKLWFLNRTEQTAESMASEWHGQVVQQAAPSAGWMDIIVNTTPLGMHPDTAATPLPHYPFKPHQVVFDMVYNPRETRLINEARQSGATVISGLDMFVAQAVRQVELWKDQALGNEFVEKMQGIVSIAQGIS